MNRRELMAALAAAGLAPAGSAFAQSGDLRQAAREAWLYCLPLVEMAAARTRTLSGRGGQPAAINSFRHARELAGPQNRAITAPNNDTLYSSAWLDLTRGPVILTVPPTGRRYISVAGMNMYTDNDFILGTRTIGGAGGRFTIVGPGQAGAGPDVVRLATPHGWLLARTLVDGPDDLPAVHKVQDALRLDGPAGDAPASTASRKSPPLEYFAAAAAVLKSDPPPATDRALFARIAPLGLSARGDFDPTRFSAAQVAEIAAGVTEGMFSMRSLAPTHIQGWSYPRGDLGFYGDDYLFRAGVALSGLAALTPSEAMYLQPLGDDGKGRMLNRDAYRLSFPAGQLPPVDGFWSLTMYEATPDAQFFLVANAANRYAIGDRTRGLTKNADGSLDIWIGRADPGPGRRSNWLPAPASGPYSLSLRAYLPRHDLIDGKWRCPALQPA
jgi:hypothetical protein